MDNMNGITPIGLVENEFRVTTSSVPNYQTKNLGLTQYTPNRVTSWLGNYNEDMRKIDKFSTSIGAYVERVLDEGDEAHEELADRINSTASVIAAVERRVDENFADHEEIRTEIQQVATGAAQKIVESEKRLVEMIEEYNESSSSILAYVQQQVIDNDTKHTLVEAGLNQRLHVAEDEILAMKENDVSFGEELDGLERSVMINTSSIHTLGINLKEVDQALTQVKKTANANVNKIGKLQVSDEAQDAAIETLQERVVELANESIATSSSILAYVQEQITVNDAKHTLAESELNQKISNTEEEVGAARGDITLFSTELDTVKGTVATHGTSISRLESGVNKAKSAATQANNKADANAAEIATLKNNGTSSSEAIRNLQNDVTRLNTGVSAAQSAAAQADRKATNAKTVADNANAKGQAAQTTAEQAMNAADNANAKSQAAQTTAQEAKNAICIATRSTDSIALTGHNQNVTALTNNAIHFDASPGVFDDSGKKVNIHLTLDMENDVIKKLIVIPALFFTFNTAAPELPDVKCGINLDISTINNVGNAIILIGKVSILQKAGAHTVTCRLRIHPGTDVVILSQGTPQANAGSSTITII